MKELMGRIDRMLSRKNPVVPETQSRDVQCPQKDQTDQSGQDLSDSIQKREVYSFGRSAASTFALMLLEEKLRKGGTVKIPSLGIVITKDHLRDDPVTGEKPKDPNSEDILPSSL